MPSAASIRTQIEAKLARQIPSALTPAPRSIRPVAGVGIPPIDELLQGGLPLGVITEVIGPECSGRTSFALSFVSRMTQAGKVSAWVDVSDALHPESAAAAGVDLERLLWVRCGGSAKIQRTATPQGVRELDQALRVTDLLLQAGGFSSIVLDMGSVAPEYVSRIPLATWFRYRAAAERTQASILLLTQHPCAKSSAGLILRVQSEEASGDEATVFTGIRHRVEVARERFTAASANVIPLRKAPQSERGTSWSSRTPWSRQR